jgi:hypothetical protein
VPSEKSESAFVFNDESHTGTDLVHFGDFPGVYVPGEPVALTEIEFDSPKEATDRAKELGIPLAKTTVAAGEGKMAARENRAPSDADVTPIEVDAAASTDEKGKAEAEGKHEGDS